MTDAICYRGLLEQKKELVFELLRLSHDLELKVDAPDESAERYVAFISSREEIITRLRGLDEELDSQPDSKEETAETEALLTEIRTMADQVIKLEPEIRKKALVLSAHYQRRLSGINTRRQEAQSRGEYTKGLRYQKSV